jgi:hypothetical protein
LNYGAKVRMLGRLLLKLETRSKTGSNRKLLLLNLTTTIPGIAIPWLLIKQTTDPTGFEFSFITFLFYSLILMFTVVSELDNLVISKTEAEIFSAMPINDNLMVNAKMFMIWRYVTFLSLPMLLPGSIFYYSILRSYPRALVYILSGFMLFFFITNVLILLYSAALRIFRSGRLSTYTLAFQMIMILVMIMVSQLISYGITGRTGSGITAYINAFKTTGIIDLFPQAWYAFLTTRNNYILEWSLILKLLLPVVICTTSYISLKMYLSENYSAIREKFLDSRIIENSSKSSNRFFLFSLFGNWVQNIYLRNNSERSSFGLLRTLFFKDKTVRLAVLPMIIIPVGLAVFALVTGQLPPPFDKNYFALKPVFHISILLCILVALNTAIHGVRITNYPGVSWIYGAFPIPSRRNFKNGFRKFFVIYLLIPVCVICGIIFLFKIPADQAILHTIFIFTASNLYNSICNLLYRALPFTKENTLINSLQRLSSIMYPLLFGAIIVVLQLFVYKSMLTTTIAAIALITITFWLNYFGFVRRKA